MMMRGRIAAAVMLFITCGLSPRLWADPRPTVTFRSIVYAPHDPLDAIQPLKRSQYRNPILPGFHPDPSIVRVGGDYYVVNSSFAFYPGLPIFHSRDLVHWTQIGNAIDRPDMFDFNGQGIARGLFAPTFRYHAGLFYIINTSVDRGGNYIITAHNVAGPWSNPALLRGFDGIDPDLFFDDDGRVWVASNGPPMGSPRYDGHRALWLQEVDLRAMKMIGPRTIIVDGGVHPADRPIWTEGPHIIKRHRYYYLIAAEGGTAGEHSETVYRASKVTGPYVPGPINPILTQRDLDPARANPVYATGHADFVQTPSGDWWAVFLGTRPYRANLSNIGRETFLLPVKWQDDWPLILPARTAVPQAARAPRLASAIPAVLRRKSAAVPDDWLMLRTPRVRWFKSIGTDGFQFEPRAEALSGDGNPSFLARRQEQPIETVTVDLDNQVSRPGDHAGLAAFADENHFYTWCVWQTDTGRELVVTLRNGADSQPDGHVVARLPLAPTTPRLKLRLNVHDPEYAFDYKLPGRRWQTLLAHADATMLASEASNQFTGVVIGPYAARQLAQK